MSSGTDGYDRALHADRDRLLAALKGILEEAIYTCKHESPGEELRGYLQTVRGHARAAIEATMDATWRPSS